MNTSDLFADGLHRNGEMLKGTLADFSDAEMLKRPTPAANHAAWQLGHLILAETGMVSAAKPGSMPELPAGFKEKFTKETSKLDDPAAFPKKAELIALFEKAREASVKWARALTPAEMDQPTPDRMQRFAPTVGHIALLMPAHTAMHVGQFQVIRRALGKPVMF
jgi:hypothetical protein